MLTILLLKKNHFSTIESPLLHKEPDIAMLNNLVGAMIPTKWEFFGQQVGVDQECLDCIRADYKDDSKQQFNRVFIEWKRRKSSDFTWNALYSKVISEYSLAENILKTLNVPVDVHDETHPKETEV